ncbi:NmrA family NAD(P)-binding protein [Tamlana sp. 2_MG-2023]|uniref:NmrA family NAD(P)-binding protein n=1 Tax=unclassified Tamlana TaxID=2614803 RepID=UPI0026E229DB|nr:MULTISPECIES: NmrA family NAD(P)-binding protein [unclassified Tamlana]MDO6761484.1 NmrA family NAD(P)-binding protein [Tamlana sp. 2_MG-2023]MDO6792341.1 NmrA family NAD(P)-binding protein [Tamlana sp. 1_MG-2023]
MTGATGNIGYEVIRFLTEINGANKIIAGVRNVKKAQNVFKAFPQLEYTHFDFEDFNTYDKALNSIDKVFLLRPPHISDIETYFKPLILKIKEKQINQIVFLSVQGVEKSKAIPHNKIEQLILEQGLDHIFLRPSYFMQNLTTTLIKDIKTKREIILPAGQAKFNWVDVQNIGEVAAMLLSKFGHFKNQAIEITGLENKNFENVTTLINSIIPTPISYRNVNPITFYRIKKREGMVSGMIMVMILLHFLPRFQKEPKISDFYERLIGKKPTDLKAFIQREKKRFE